MKSLEDLSSELLHALNFVAFDACDLSTVQYEYDADPLKITLQCNLRAPIPRQLHAMLRKNIKDTAYASGWAAGRIALERTLLIVLYKQRTHAPAYVHGDSPQG